MDRCQSGHKPLSETVMCKCPSKKMGCQTAYDYVNWLRPHPPTTNQHQQHTAKHSQLMSFSPCFIIFFSFYRYSSTLINFIAMLPMLQEYNTDGNMPVWLFLQNTETSLFMVIFILKMAIFFLWATVICIAVWPIYHSSLHKGEHDTIHQDVSDTRWSQRDGALISMNSANIFELWWRCLNLGMSPWGVGLKSTHGNSKFL